MLVVKTQPKRKVHLHDPREGTHCLDLQPSNLVFCGVKRIEAT